MCHISSKPKPLSFTVPACLSVCIWAQVERCGRGPGSECTIKRQPVECWGPQRPGLRLDSADLGGCFDAGLAQVSLPQGNAHWPGVYLYPPQPFKSPSPPTSLPIQWLPVLSVSLKGISRPCSACSGVVMHSGNTVVASWNLIRTADRGISIFAFFFFFFLSEELRTCYREAIVRSQTGALTEVQR